MTKLILAAVAAVVAVAQASAFTFPAPAAGHRMTAGEYCRVTHDMSWEDRDSVTLAEVRRGNIPDYLRQPVSVTDTLADAIGDRHVVTLEVLPDFLAIGPDSGYMLVPVMPVTGQLIADMLGASLVTPRISDIINRHAAVRLTPHPMTPDSAMTTTPVFWRHDSIVRSAYTPVPGQIIDGHKKDIVLCNGIAERRSSVFIYGWHRPDGSVIQPLYGGHGIRYLDYSHGLRLVSRRVIVDGREYDIADLLTHPVLYRLLSGEPSPMPLPRYSLLRYLLP